MNLSLLKMIGILSGLSLGCLCMALPSPAAPPQQGRNAAVPPKPSKSETGVEPERSKTFVKPEAPTQSGAKLPTLRRLTRYEYDRTLHDLIGIDFNSQNAVGIPEETVPLGFDNMATAMNIAPTLMEKYMAAADKILERLTAGPNGRVADGNDDTNKAQAAHNALFRVKPGKEMPPREAARANLSPFVQRAWRRPVSEAEIEALLKLYDRAAARNLPFEEAMRPALKATLVSPWFLFRVEPNTGGATNGLVRVGDYALASRLSYFLWSSMPDAVLFDLAAQNQLLDPTVLQAQVKRMLADPKAHALTENFAAQWLQIRRLPQARPSTDFFPTFNGDLRETMYDETATFFDKLREEDRSTLDLLDADYTYLNEALATHYGIAGVSGPQMRLVKLRPEDHRGGLLGMSSVLALTSHTYRTSPTLRGKWILEVLFGTPPPPPPPGVSQIRDEQQKQKTGTTFRALLAQHAGQPACAGCHAKIDPLGFAMENYDAIGRWRKEQGGQPLDTAGMLPTGEKLNGSDALKRLLIQRKEIFLRNMTGQMLAYALGRQLERADTATINDIAADMQQNGSRFSVLVTDLVMSRTFRYRRNVAVPPDIAPPAAPPPAKPPGLHPAKPVPLQPVAPAAHRKSNRGR